MGMSLSASLRLHSSSPISMGAELASARNTMENAFRSSAKSRSVRAHASEGDIEGVVPANVQPESSGTVLPFVGVACLGAVLFGYHLGVVNGALEFLSKDLGIAENIALQGWVVSTTLDGATLGSFTGGSLADKFGRTKTFILDVIPLAVGACLCATASTVETMIVGCLLCGIGIGISSAIVPLYISEPLPKFGEWDVNDPTSAEGFTTIFNNARDEKKIGGKPDSPVKIDPGLKHMDAGKPQAEKWFCCMQSPHVES